MLGPLCLGYTERASGLLVVKRSQVLLVLVEG